MRVLNLNGFFALAGVLLLSGCAMLTPKPEVEKLPDGALGFHVKCYASLTACHQQARSVCDGDYNMVDRASFDRDGKLIPGSNTNRGLDTTHQILVKCEDTGAVARYQNIEIQNPMHNRASIDSDSKAKTETQVVSFPGQEPSAAQSGEISKSSKITKEEGAAYKTLDSDAGDY